MGYRSDVKVITTKEGWSRIKKAVEETTPQGAWLVDETYTVPICEGKYILAEWEDVKWYDWGDNIISTFMKELRKLDEDNIPYEFMRVGEDWGDVERICRDTYFCSEYDDMPSLWLKREIEVEYN